MKQKSVTEMTHEELLARVVGKKVKFTLRGNTVEGTITGGIFNPMDHFYIFKAFHIVVDGTGEKYTELAMKVTILS